MNCSMKTRSVKKWFKIIIILMHMLECITVIEKNQLSSMYVCGSV